ncbi:hypothetical protein [Microbacterium hydrocarbonoxydans]|uniref:hypothetical protein n=1 Tax=Microbacterium hydrocarbonoxydans TaxID=273678 RepID=UPI0011150746|nr:hypothetical protein [Microbacterium hydrocarbonoxydans]
MSGDAAAGRRRLALRVPEWVSGRTVTLLATARRGCGRRRRWILIDDALVDGAEIELRLPVEVDVIHRIRSSTPCGNRRRPTRTGRLLRGR